MSRLKRFLITLKIKPRLTAAFLILIILLVLPLLVFSSFWRKQAAVDSYKSMLHSTTLSISNAASTDYYQQRINSLQSIIDRLDSDENSLMAEIVDTDCNIVVHSNTSKRGERDTTELSNQAVKLEKSKVWQDLDPEHGDVICVAVPLYRLDNTLELRHQSKRPALIFLSSMKPVFDEMRNWNTWMVILGASSIVLGLISASIFAQSITKPLLELHRGVRRITAGEMDYRIQELQPQKRKVKDEVAEINQAFNRMVHQINLMSDEKLRNQSLVTLGRFATMIVHHLKNPLYGIFTWVDIISGYVQQEESPERTRAITEGVQNISEAINKMNHFIKDTLDFAKPFTLELSAVSLKEIVLETLASIDLDQKITLITEFDEDAPTVDLDKRRFSMALSCLINNAIEAMPDGGTLTIKTFAHPRIGLSIEDNGIGIPSKILEKIFTPFFTTKERGDGMGLMFAKKIIENHGGCIEVESVVGKGSAFRMLLPDIRLSTDSGKEIQE
ncbi:HAMP domain-containing protein [candidate division KSB1 bacterium]|nr:HAMP domain-containing protein [candidate division KSB1 bacterium]